MTRGRALVIYLVGCFATSFGLGKLAERIGTPAPERYIIVFICSCGIAYNLWSLLLRQVDKEKLTKPREKKP